MNEPAVVISVRDIVNSFGTQVVHDHTSVELVVPEVKLEMEQRLGRGKEHRTWAVHRARG